MTAEENNDHRKRKCSPQKRVLFYFLGRGAYDRPYQRLGSLQNAVRDGMGEVTRKAMTVEKFKSDMSRYVGIDSCDCLASQRAREMYIGSSGFIRGHFAKTFHLYRNLVIAECMECDATWMTWEKTKKSEFVLNAAYIISVAF